MVRAVISFDGLQDWMTLNLAIGWLIRWLAG